MRGTIPKDKIQSSLMSLLRDESQESVNKESEENASPENEGGSESLLYQPIGNGLGKIFLGTQDVFETKRVTPINQPETANQPETSVDYRQKFDDYMNSETQASLSSWPKLASSNSGESPPAFAVSDVTLESGKNWEEAFRQWGLLSEIEKFARWKKGIDINRSEMQKYLLNPREKLQSNMIQKVNNMEAPSNSDRLKWGKDSVGSTDYGDGATFGATDSEHEYSDASDSSRSVRRVTWEDSKPEGALKGNTENTKSSPVGSYQQGMPSPEAESFFNRYDVDLEAQSANEIAQDQYPRAQYVGKKAREMKNQWDSMFENKLPECQYYRGEDGGYFIRYKNGESVKASEQDIPVDTVVYLYDGVDKEGRNKYKQVIKTKDGTFREIKWGKFDLGRSVALERNPLIPWNAGTYPYNSIIGHDTEGNEIIGEDGSHIFKYPNQKEENKKLTKEVAAQIPAKMRKSTRSWNDIAVSKYRSPQVFIPDTSEAEESLIEFWLGLKDLWEAWESRAK